MLLVASRHRAHDFSFCPLLEKEYSHEKQSNGDFNRLFRFLSDAEQ